MRIYVAAKYGRRAKLRSLVAKLEELGHESTSQWINDGEEGRGIQDAAIMDVQDVLRAECLIFIGEPQGCEIRGGGRWFEFGLAYGRGLRCICVLNLEELPNVGDRSHLPPGHESVFSALPNVQIVTSEDDLLTILGD